MKTYMADEETPNKPEPKRDPGWDNPTPSEPIDKGAKLPKGKVFDLEK